MPKPESTLSIDQERTGWSTRIIAKIEALLLVLVLLSLGFAGVDDYERAAIAAGLFIYAAFVLALQYSGVRRAGSRWIVAAQTWAMIPFITWAIWFTDKLASPLRNAYLLVIIVSALTAGMRTTMYQLGLIAACLVLTEEVSSVEVLLSFGHLSELLARLTPLIIVAYVTSNFSADIRYGMRKASLLSEIDEVTGLCNIRGFAIAADRLLGHAARHEHGASLMMIAIDDFKAIAQARGREAGNDLLCATAKRIAAELRHNDVLARHRGDGFLVLLQETVAPGALEVAERIRSAVAAAPVVCGDKSMTASVGIGLASYDGAGGSIDAVLAGAEHALQMAQEQGDSKIVMLPA